MIKLSNMFKNKFTRIKEKLLIIKHIFRSGQYAFYAINSGYKNRHETPEKASCIISDNATVQFLEAVIEHTEDEIKINNLLDSFNM